MLMASHLAARFTSLWDPELVPYSLAINPQQRYVAAILCTNEQFFFN